MLDRYIAEATQCDFKQALEVRKPKSWLKSVCAFANGIGGRLLFGVDDGGRPVGLPDIREAADRISELIAARISPMPQVTLEPFEEDGKAILSLTVQPGQATPYYYQADGNRETFVRIGNESIIAPNHIIKELILKGTNSSFDAIVTDDRRSAYSFTLLEATYREQTTIPFEPMDYLSFGLADADGKLTNAGRLMADQSVVYNSRMFCTRWNGLEKGSVFDDALDDKEFKGNLISLLQNGRNFVKNNSHVRFAKGPEYRIEKPDYAERAVTEALVNALIHRDYILKGAEIHIDMYDDRLEITSPGGMINGSTIQECDIFRMGSFRRNPVIADLFHRMRFMERRGSGLGRIVAETEKLPGYEESMRPVFRSDAASFTVILRNVNYAANSKENSKENNKENSNKISSLTDRLDKKSKTSKEIDKENSTSNTKIDKESGQNPEVKERIIRILSKNPKSSVRQIACALGESDTRIRYHLELLKTSEAIRREGPTKSGRWIVVKED